MLSMLHPVCEAVQLLSFRWEFRQVYPPNPHRPHTFPANSLAVKIGIKKEQMKCEFEELPAYMPETYVGFWIIAPNINPLQCSPLILIYRTHTQTQLCFMFYCRCLTHFLRFFLIPGGNKLNPTQTNKALQWRSNFPENCLIYLN